jgi:sterol desaturase/sphingolipid hydroxylase (fatty acid hydroxylase superfamily)
MTFGICYYLTGLIQKNIQFGLLSYVDSIFLQATIMLVAADFKNYIRHLVFHRSKSLFMLHAMHHSAEEMTMLTAQRGHFVESAISAFFDVVVFMLLGPSFAGLIFVQAVRDFHQLLIHSNMQSGWGFIGKYILVSPAAHRLHHSTDEKHFNKNIGSLFIFWDRMFGTYYPPEKIETIGLNIDGMHHTGFAKQLWISYRNFWIGLAGRKKI